MSPRKKKSSQHLVPVGTHVPTTTKLALQAIAESQNKSVYEFLQGLIQDEVDEYEQQIDSLKGKSKKPIEDSGADLL